MSLKGHALVEDIRAIGLVCGIDLAPIAGSPGKRAYLAMETGFHDHDIMLRITGDTIALSPPLIVSEDHIDEMFAKKLPAILKSVS
jgi:beta-alanine--pyruvate transaminase